MRRFLYPMIFLVLVVSTNAQVLLSKPADAQAQNPVPPDSSSGAIPRYAATQNVPCVGQPRSLRELASSFQQGQLPLASQITGTWVEIGFVWNDPPTHHASLNCSGEKRGGKFEFLLLANGYSAELHAVGTYVQKVTMQTDHKGSVEFPVDFGADEGPETYRCRLSKRGTLTCLDGAYSGVEFKKMAVEKGQIH